MVAEVTGPVAVIKIRNNFPASQNWIALSSEILQRCIFNDLYFVTVFIFIKPKIFVVLVICMYNQYCVYFS